MGFFFSPAKTCFNITMTRKKRRSRATPNTPIGQPWVMSENWMMKAIYI
jgi:hypothetical protein